MAFPTWMPLAVGVVAMAVFVLRQLHAAEARQGAARPAHLRRSPNYTLSVVTMAIAMMALFGMIILLPIYLQNVLGLDTLQTGLLLLPGSLLMGLLGPIGRPALRQDRHPAAAGSRHDPRQPRAVGH